MWWVAVSACTPLGLWLYEEPGFEVQRVRLQPSRQSDSTVVVALLLWNPNDYELSTARFDLKLRLDGATVGHYARDSVVPMGQVETTELALTFMPTSTAAGSLASFASGTHSFLVEGRATFDTPFGRRTIRVEHGGAIAFGEATEPAGGEGERRLGSPAPDWSSTMWPRLEPTRPSH
jgi:hypothetical protein